jgi:phage terminase large subunit-like protein
MVWDPHVGGSQANAVAGCSVLAPEKNPAEAAIKFLESLKIPEGPLAGQPVRLAEFQKKFIRGALDPANMIAVWSIGRGNSKTATSVGALALPALMGITVAQPKREILFCARNRDQAKIAFNFLVGFTESLPKREREKFTIRRGSRLEVEYSGRGGGLARCIASDGKSILGGASHLAILDERAAWPTDKGQEL